MLFLFICLVNQVDRLESSLSDLVNKINWLETILLLDFPRCSFDQELLDCPRIRKMISRSHCKVKWCVPNRVSCIDLTAPRLQVVTCSVWSCKACPMQWRASFVINRVDTDSLVSEVCQTVCLISLCCYMHHVNAHLVLDCDVSTILR